MLEFHLLGGPSQRKDEKVHTQKREDLPRQTCTADFCDTINTMYTFDCKCQSRKEIERRQFRAVTH